jgi:hypothetical protein
MIMAISCSGCGANQGPRRVAIEGRIRVDGLPLASGVIRFIPTSATGGPAAVAVVTNGAYSFAADDGPVVGTHRVEIEAAGYLPFPLDDEESAAQWAMAGNAVPRNPLPGIYNTHSTLAVEVAADGGRQFDFDLLSAGAAARAP